jgi:hypothetical protein
MYIVWKYKIYLHELLKKIEKGPFWRVSLQVQINFIFSNNVCILCLSCKYCQNAQNNSKILLKRAKRRVIQIRVSSVMSSLYCCHFLPFTLRRLGRDHMVVEFIALWVRIQLRWGALDTTSCDKVCQWLAAGLWFSPGPPVSSTNKTDRHDTTEILLKVVLNTIALTLSLVHSLYINQVPGDFYLYTRRIK